MSRRTIRKPTVPRIEILETRQMLSRGGAAAPTLPFAAAEMVRHPRILTPRPDLDAFAWDLIRHPKTARMHGLEALAQQLERHAGLVAREGAGATLAWVLAHHPAYVHKHGLGRMLQPPTARPPIPSPVGPPGGSLGPVVPPVVMPSAPPSTPPAGSGTPPTGPPVTVVPEVVPVGTVLTLQALHGNLAPALTTYTITPQPLPENMTFNSSTGALRFVPSAADTGTTAVTVTASDGVATFTEQIPITVVNQPTVTTEVSGQVVDEAGNPLAAVPVAIGSRRATTGADGRFTLDGLPANPGPLMLDGPHADAAGSRMMLMAPAEQLVGHPVYGGVDNIIPRPLVLPRVDLAHATDFRSVDPSRPIDLTSPLLPGAVLHVAPHSAMTLDGKPFTGMLSLTPLPVSELQEVMPVGFTPSSLFGVDGPDLLFSTPATLTMPNTSNLAPGTPLELLSMDMTSGQFVVTGHMQVSAGGRTLEMTDGGILNSSCVMTRTLCRTFPAPPNSPPAMTGLGMPNSPGPVCDTVVFIGPCGCTEGASGNAQPPGAGPLGGGGLGDGGILRSDASLVTGEYYQDHATVAYTSQGIARSLDFQYSSLQAQSTPSPEFVMTAGSDAPNVTQLQLQVSIGGVNANPVTYNNPGLVNGTVIRMAEQVDTRSLPTGSYLMTVTLTKTYTDLSSVEEVYTTPYGVVNLAPSPYGAGWSIGGLAKVFPDSASSSALVTGGSQGNEEFTTTDGTHYTGPMGDTSTLIHNTNGTWTRSFPDGTVVQLNSSGQETSQADRNGNTTTYAYVTTGPAAGGLQTVTDPVNLATNLAYDGSGHLSTLTDPASRVTSFTLDSSANLTKITDPDSAIWQYGYGTPSNHVITSETDPNNHTATAAYDTFGRLASETLPDTTSITRIGGAEEKDLLAPNGSGRLGSMTDYQGTVTDPLGHTTTLTFDSMDHPSTAVDPLRNGTSYVRNMEGWPTQITDANAHTVTYGYDSRGNLTGITRPDQTSMSIVYDPNFSQPTQITDYRGLITTFTLDSHGNALRRTDPDLLHEDFTYNSAGQILTDTDRNGHTTSFTYDSHGMMTAVTEPDTGAGIATIAYGYDPAGTGNLTEVTDELNQVVTYTYDKANRILSSQDPVQAAAGKMTSYSYDAAGNRTSVIDANGHATSFVYDARNRVVGVVDPVNQGTTHRTTLGYDAVNLTSIVDPNGNATTYGYDLDNRVNLVTDALNHTVSFSYDGIGQETGTTDGNGNATTYSYDAENRLASTTLPGTAPNGLGQQVAVNYNYGYNADDLLTSTTDALGHATSMTFDNLNRETAVIDALGHAVSFGYDPAGNRTSVTDANNNPTSYVYDQRNRLTSQTSPSGGGTTTFTYDQAGRLASLTDPVLNRTTFGYDAANREVAETDALGKLTTYSYDLVGNLTGKTDRLGRIFQYGYDADNRETTETWIPVGGGMALRTVTMTYDPGGRETGIVDPNSQYAYGYDQANRLTSANDAGTPTLPQVTLTYGYDNASNRASVDDSLGGLTSYTYDVRNELTSLKQSGTGVAAKRVDYAYDAGQRMTTMTRYSDLAGTQTVIASGYTYDAANRLTGLVDKTAGGTVRTQYGYTLDAANRLTQETRTWTSGGGTASDTVGYTYTNDNQLTGVTHTNNAYATETYSFDTNGNRTMTGYSTTTGNRLASDGTFNYLYDAEGNLLSKTQISNGNQTVYTWDYRNRLTEVDSVISGNHTVLAQFTYDALDRRIGVVEGSTAKWTLWDGATPYLDFNGSGTQTARYLDGNAVDEVLARETSGGTVAWYLADREGTVRDLADNTGAIIDHVDCNGFGQVVGETAPSVGDRFKYAGMQLDAATNLDYAWHRYYDAAAGRFISQDPSSFDGLDSNNYRYVHNDPTDAIDSTGLKDSWGSSRNRVGNFLLSESLCPCFSWAGCALRTIQNLSRYANGQTQATSGCLQVPRLPANG